MARGNPVERWAEELAAWRIPDDILARAPESPWGFPPSLFGAARAPVGALHRMARAALGDSGTVLDVGCGGGAASVPLVPPASRLVGVDTSPEMLESFARAAEEAGAAHTEVLGEWPGVAGQVQPAEVAVCRNVVYNVAAIAPFLASLTRCATNRVVLELTEAHPSVPLAPLWMRFWGLPRPGGPTAELFADVMDRLGYEFEVERETRPAMKPEEDPAKYVEFIRRRLCLDPSRDREVADALEDVPRARGEETTVMVLAWRPRRVSATG